MTQATEQWCRAKNLGLQEYDCGESHVVARKETLNLLWLQQKTEFFCRFFEKNVDTPEKRPGVARARRFWCPMVEHFLPPVHALAEEEGPQLFILLRNTANLKHNWLVCSLILTTSLLSRLLTKLELAAGTRRGHAGFGGYPEGDSNGTKFHVMPAGGNGRGGTFWELAVEARLDCVDVSFSLHRRVPRRVGWQATG